MSDLVERLLAWRTAQHPMGDDMHREAADEITRLTAHIVTQRGEIDKLIAEVVTLNARVEELENVCNHTEAQALGLATENAALTARVEELEYALATVMGTPTHGMNMSWEERCKIARAALTKPAPEWSNTIYDESGFAIGQKEGE